MPKYQRIVLKLSGEVMAGGSPFGIDPERVKSLAREIAVNRHCLFDSFEQAKAALETGKFDNTEPGPHRIFAVYSV